MTDEKLGSEQAICEAATPEPWIDLCSGNDCSANGSYMIRSAVHTEEEAVIQLSRHDGSPWCLPEDREFIIAARTGYPEALRELQETRTELSEMNQSFELRWQADLRAIERWQKATGKTMTWPDCADLSVWLMDRLEAAEEKIAEASAALKESSASYALSEEHRQTIRSMERIY